jgi:CubicO group peptidase (beta-lactamase class C family)
VATHPADVLAESAETSMFPSIVAACLVGGRVCWTGGAGRHARIAGRPADPGDQYRIGSITKTMTAVAVLQLRDSGRLDLSDPVSAHVPDAPFGDRLIRSLLSHASGMPAEPAGAWWERAPGVDRTRLWHRNVGRPDVFAPGERYHYSNLSFAVLGAVVEEVSGLGWFEYVESKVLSPLEMARTTYHPTGAAAEGTSRTPDGRLVAEPAEDSGAMAPAGQLWSTVGDLARWGAFLANGAPGVLDRSTLVEMQTVQSGDPDTQHRGGYGLGHRLLWTDDGTIVGHSGSMPGFLADLQVDPRTGAGAVVLVNATTPARTSDPTGRLRRWASEQVGLGRLDPRRVDGRAGSGQADRERTEPGRSQPGQSTEPTPSPPWGAEPLLARAAGPMGPVADELVGAWYWGNTPYELTATEHGCRLRSHETTWCFAGHGPDRYLGLTGYPAGEVLQVRRRGDGRVEYLEVATFVLRRVSSPG